MKKASVLPPLTCRDSTPSPSFSANCVGEKIPQIVFLSVHIFWACFPVGRSPLAPPGVAERSFLSVLYLLPCSSAPVCHRQPADWGSRANRHSTQWTRRIIFVEGRDRDRSSHNSPHHQYFGPSRELDKKSLTYTDCYLQNTAHSSFGKSSDKRVYLRRPIVRQRSATDSSLTGSRHITLII